MNTTMKKFNICLIGLLLLFSTSCEDMLDINTSPNDPAQAPVELVFPAAAGSAAYVIGGWYQILGGMWSQHWTQSTGASQYRNIDSYDLQTDAFDGYQYGELYAGALNDLEYVKTTAKANQNWSYYLMATVVQSYVYQVLVDLYDKIPFTDALKGNQAVLSPKFDDGQLVYDSLIARLDDALSRDLSAITVQTPGKDDVIFGGDLEKWVQFANTLKLKIFIRESEAKSGVASAGIQSLFAAPNFLTVDATFDAFKDEVDSRNPVYETGVDRLAGNITISRTLFTYLNDNADPRLDAIANYPEDTPATHNTLVQGDYLSTSPTNISGLSTPNLQPLDPVYFISAAESYFLQAEAVVRFGVAGDAASLYEQGIDASFEKFGVTDDPSAMYGSGAPYEFPTSSMDAQIEAIITQKWIAMANSQGLESFFEQNRTGYPDFYTPAVNNVTSDKFPRRLFYPQSERSRNPSNLPEIQPLTEPVWWAQ
jgi:hypothetical protein